MKRLPRQPDFTVLRSEFPDDFKFGTSTSAYQIEGSKFGGCGSSHWDTFAATPGNVTDFDNGSIACGHYERWREDLDLLQALGVDNYRFSTSWARVLPEGRGAVNQDGLDFYDRLVDGMLERNVEPHLTLYHWELPSALADIGGWRNPDIANYFADYAEIIAKKLGDRLASIATFNEPWCVCWLSHFIGMHAPGLQDVRAAARAMHIVPVSHGKAVEAMRALGQDNIGVVLNFEHTTALDDKESSIRSANLADAIYNHWFLGAFTKGTYPDVALDSLAPYLPERWEQDMATVNPKLDWLGVNYYTRVLVSEGETKQGSALPVMVSNKGDRPRTMMDWEVYPEGLYELLCWMRETYTHDLPLAITENGMANNDKVIDGTVDDQERIAFLDAHFKQALLAIGRGVPLKSYFVWSLMDNFEWSFGNEKRFGLVHIDFDSLERTPKASYHALRDFLNKGA